MNKLSQLRLYAVGLLTAASVYAGKSPFEATATTTLPANNITITASGNNLEDFLSSLVNAQGQFSQLDNKPFDASTTFLGVANAITFSSNTTGTVVTMALGPIGFNRTFTGSSSEDVEDQITDFFEKEGAETIAEFLKAIAKKSPVAVTDGNPNSATAVMASSLFLGQGFTPVDEIGFGLGQDMNADGSEGKPRFGGFGVGFNAGKFEAAGFEGETLDVSVSGLNFGLGERVRLVTPISLNYLKVEGAEVAGLGGSIALPIRFKVMNKDNRWNWRVTPLAGISARASVDLGSGALLWQAGAINSVDYRVNSKLVFAFINQFTFHKSIELEYEDYSFDPKIDQQIMKNGVRLVSPLTRRLIGDLFAVDTRFLKDAAVDQFWSFGGSLSLRASQRFNLTLGANYDTGDNFESYSVGLSSAWKW